MNQKDIDNIDFRFRKGHDRQGPVPVAVLVGIPSENNIPTVRLICFGDSDFISDEFFDVLSNKDVFLNTLSWMSQQENLISIRPSTFMYPYHFLKDEQVKWIFWPIVVIQPLLFLLIGWSVFLIRKIRV